MGTTDHRGGLVPKHLDPGNLVTEIDSLNFTTKWQGRTVVCTTGCHRIFKEFDSLNFVTETAGQTIAGTTGHNELRNPDTVGFLLKVFTGCFGLFLLMIIKLVV